MDYAGLGRRHQYPINRPLTIEEQAARYRQKEAKDDQPMDFLSVIKMNSTYVDLVDRWYSIRGFWAWLSAIIGASSLGMAFFIIYFILFWNGQRPAEPWFPYAALVVVVLMLGFVWLGVSYPFKLEFLRWTHYPIRLNRENRNVYFFRQNGTVLIVPWCDLFIVRGKSRNPLTGTTYDLRAHILGPDGVTVRESFSLGYPSPVGNVQSIDKFWAFLQPYMEAPDGVERTYRHLKSTGYLAPVDGRKEGWRWSIARSFMLAANWPSLQLLFSPVFGLNAVGRMFAMWTSKQPHWPQEVEDVSKVDADDPYVLTWRDNAPLGWWELGWPLVCTVLGVCAFTGVIVWIISLLGK